MTTCSFPLDIDECDDLRNGGCSHSCMNLVGSYKCTCPTGFALKADNRTCSGEKSQCALEVYLETYLLDGSPVNLDSKGG